MRNLFLLTIVTLIVAVLANRHVAVAGANTIRTEVRSGAPLSGVAFAKRETSRSAIWFAPLDNVVRPTLQSGGAIDFSLLFNGFGGWDLSSKDVAVFKLYPQYLRSASDAELSETITGLKRMHIALAIEFGILHPSQNCGHLEGHDQDQVAIAQRVRRLGGEIAFFAADEPLFFGHSFDGREGCQTPLDQMAGQAADVARQLRQVFPNIQFVDIEPISNFKEPDLPELISRWHSAFRSAFGEPFAAFDIDIDWNRPWQERARLIAQRMAQDGMRLGLICNGNPDEPSDAVWIAHALTNCEAYQTVTGTAPDDVIFQSWVPRPTHVLPETAPDSFTHLILDYVARHPQGTPRH